MGEGDRGVESVRRFRVRNSAKVWAEKCVVWCVPTARVSVLMLQSEMVVRVRNVVR